MNVSSDDHALLGLDVMSGINPDSDNEPLVEVVNNAGTELNVSVDLIDQQGSEYVSPGSETSISVNHSQMFTTYLDSDRGTENAVEFDITATDGESITIDLRRQTNLSNPPTLKRHIIDRTRDTNVKFDVQYQIRNTPDFESMELHVQRCGVLEDDDGSCNPTGNGTTIPVFNSEGVISYPENGSDGGAEGHTYEFTFSVFSDDSEPIIEETTRRVAGSESENDDDDDFSSEGDPELEWFTVKDQSSEQDGTTLTVDYQVDVGENSENFGGVDVIFDTDADRGGHWADETMSSQELTDELTHMNEGTYDSAYEVTVQVKSPNGITLDSESVSIQSGSHETIEWP